MVERGKNVSHFRLVIVNGKAYVVKYDKVYQTRDVFTIWGILTFIIITGQNTVSILMFTTLIMVIIFSVMQTRYL